MPDKDVEAHFNELREKAIKLVNQHGAARALEAARSIWDALSHEDRQNLLGEWNAVLVFLQAAPTALARIEARMAARLPEKERPMTPTHPALRALLERVTKRILDSEMLCLVCGGTHRHQPDCPVPAAREELERVERGIPTPEEAEDALALGRDAYDHGVAEGRAEGYAAAREQAAGICDAKAKRCREPSHHERDAAAIRAMTPNDRSPDTSGAGTR